MTSDKPGVLAGIGSQNPPTPPPIPTLPMGQLADAGLLWLINSTVFWPRGYSLMIDTTRQQWTLLGDGSEPWVTDEDTAKGRFIAVTETFETFRRLNAHD